MPPPEASPAIVVDSGDHYKVAQAFYAAVTGKTENVSRAYSKDYIIDLENLRQLHLRCQQIPTICHVLQKSDNVTIYHLDDNKEVFSSFDRFLMYDMSRMTATESVHYEMNLLIEAQDIPKPHPYKISVMIMSRMTLIKRMEDDLPPPAFLRYFSKGSIVIEVEYVDYVMAHHILTMLDGWVKEVEVESKYGIIRKLQRFSHWSHFVCQLIALSIIGLAIIKTSPLVVPAESSISLATQWIVFCTVLLWVVNAFSRQVGELIENGIDQILGLSAILLNKGDQRLREKYNRRNIFKSAQVMTGIAIILAQGIASSYLYDIIKGVFK